MDRVQEQQQWYHDHEDGFSRGRLIHCTPVVLNELCDVPKCGKVNCIISRSGELFAFSPTKYIYKEKKKKGPGSILRQSSFYLLGSTVFTQYYRLHWKQISISLPEFWPHFLGFRTPWNFFISHFLPFTQNLFSPFSGELILKEKDKQGFY